MKRHIASRIGCVLLSCATLVPGQNVVTEDADGETAAPIELSLAQAEAWSHQAADYRGRIEGREARRIAGKLEAHVSAFLDGHPWMPFQHTLGISGYETCFDHPDELFYALSIALPYLTDETRQRTETFLDDQVEQVPPYQEQGFDWRTGRARERYIVPESLRRRGRGRARSAFGVYAFWAWCHYAERKEAAQAHWPEVRARIRGLVENSYEFDIRRQDYTHDEAEILNGDLAGVLGAVRLARMNGEPDFAEQALARARELLELRVNLGRVNPQIVRRTHSSTKHLHVYKLPRFVQLVPEAGRALRQWTEAVETGRLRRFHGKRPGWHMAFGDRLIGGENYTNPPHLSRALFSGAALIEKLSSDQLMRWIDVPWCDGDFYFMEKCVYALWANEGRHWTAAQSVF